MYLLASFGLVWRGSPLPFHSTLGKHKVTVMVVQHDNGGNTSLLHSSAQKRWRVLYLTIYLSRAMLSLSTTSSTTKTLKNLKNPTTISSPPSSPILQNEPGTEPEHRCDERSTLLLHSSAQKRWRFLYLAIYSSRAMLSLFTSSSKCETLKNPTTTTSSPPSFSVPHPEADDTTATATAFFFGIDKAELAALAKEKNSTLLCRLGGIDGVASKLGTDKDKGINDDEADVGRRRQLFGSNAYYRQPSKSLFYFIKDAFKDTTIIISLACGAIYLGFGIKEQGLEKGWYGGGSIFIGAFLVTAVSGASDFLLDRLFDSLPALGDSIQVEVVRGGRRRAVSIFDIVVGDVVVLDMGDRIPADGLLLRGVSVHVDDPSMTGESDHVEVEPTGGKNPFLISGGTVVDGHGAMVVTAVGMGTAWGEMMSSIARDSGGEQTPLQARLHGLTETMKKVGLAVASVVLMAMLVRYFAGCTEDEEGRREFYPSRTAATEVVKAVLMTVVASSAVVIAAIPEGQQPAMKLKLAYSMKRMMGEKVMVRKLSACETMCSVDVICPEKTGALTLNQLKVTEFWVGTDAIVGEGGAKVETAVSGNFLNLLRQAVGFNTTGIVYRPAGSSEDAELEFSGSPTEKAILSWAVKELGMDIEKPEQDWSVVQMENFNSERKRSGVLLKEKGGIKSGAHVHWKGAAEMVLARCSTYYDSKGSVEEIDREKRSQMESMIQGKAARSLRCIAFAHKRIQENQESSERRADDRGKESEGKTTQKSIEEEELTLLGIVGLRDPCLPEVKKAVRTCQDAGVEIKMITGDNVFTAKAIATECGILGPDQQSDASAVTEGSDFRNFTDEERMQKIDRIRVMARSFPSDKLLMVQCLKRKGHVVAVTGDDTNDALALKEADIGLSLGINGTGVDKETADIVILDENFASDATVLLWGRCVYSNVQKFIQFRLTEIVAALVINFIAAVSGRDVPFTFVQLLWMNLVTDTLGALALATDHPTDEQMQRPPVERSEPLITNIMWRNLLAQALYQIAVRLALEFRGEAIFNVSEEVNDTMIFSTFVLCQVFNLFNCRKLEKKNVFAGLHRDWLFVGIAGATVVLQVVMVELLKAVANTERLDWSQWGACVGIAAVSWPIGWVVKLMPVPEKPFLSNLPLRRMPAGNGCLFFKC